MQTASSKNRRCCRQSISFVLLNKDYKWNKWHMGWCGSWVFTQSCKFKRCFWWNFKISVLTFNLYSSVPNCGLRTVQTKKGAALQEKYDNFKQLLLMKWSVTANDAGPRFVCWERAKEADAMSFSHSHWPFVHSYTDITEGHSWYFFFLHLQIVDGVGKAAPHSHARDKGSSSLPIQVGAPLAIAGGVTTWSHLMPPRLKCPADLQRRCLLEMVWNSI